MARARGLLKLSGGVGGMLFYINKYGNFVRSKGNLTKERVTTEPAFENSRKTSLEFGQASQAGKFFRTAMQDVAGELAGGHTSGRITKLMQQLKSHDLLSPKGQRTEHRGLSTAEGRAVMRGFDFNKRVALFSVLRRPFSANAGTGEIVLKDLVARTDIKCPAGCTHIRLRGGLVNINFALRLYSSQLTNSVTISVKQPAIDILLKPSILPGTDDSTGLLLLGIDFLQAVNGVEYSLKDGSKNVLAVVEVG